MMTPDQLRDLQNRGWRVMPIPAGQKAPPPAGWQHEDRLYTEDEMSAWPGNAAVKAGLSCLVIVDLDEYKPGYRADEVLALGLPETFEVRSPRGGRHLYYEVPGGIAESITLRPSTNTLDWEGFDIRAGASYVVSPGSFAEGGAYQVIRNVPPAPAPEVIMALARRGRLAEPTADPEARAGLNWATEIERAKTLPSGVQNESLLRFCASVRAAGLPDDQSLGLISLYMRNLVNYDLANPWTLDFVREMWRRTKERIEAPMALSTEVIEWATSSSTTAAEDEAKKMVAAEKLRESVRRAAREELDEEALTAAYRPPAPAGIATILSVEPDYPSYHVDGLWPYGGTVVLQAAKKWGKSTMMRNLATSALTGSEFLGRFEITAKFQRALVIDMELTERQFWDYWKGVTLGDDQMTVWRLRGSSSTMAIRSDWVRREVVSRIKDTGADLVILDPLGPVLRACGFEENSNDDVGRLLDIWDEVLADAGVTASVVPHHMGHTGEHGRGASVLGDKADAIWTGTYARAGFEEGPRFLSARGRMPDFESRQLDYDPETGLLTMGEFATARKEAAKDRKTEEALIAAMMRTQQVKDALAARPEGFTSQRALKDHLGVTWNGERFADIRSTLLKEGLIKDGVAGFVPVTRPDPGAASEAPKTL